MSLIDLFAKGGFMMWPLLACSVAALAVIIDRAWAFYLNSKIDNRALRAKLMNLVQEGRLEDAQLLCDSTRGPIAAVLLAGLQSYSKHKEMDKHPEALIGVMEKSMDDYSQFALSAVEKRLTVLATVSNAAPLLGMAGTVMGMIAAFGTIETLKTMDPAAMAGGISEALITTAAGLLIALAAVIPFSYFSSLAEKISLEIEESTTELLDFVATRVERGS